MGCFLILEGFGQSTVVLVFVIEKARKESALVSMQVVSMGYL